MGKVIIIGGGEIGKTSLAQKILEQNSDMIIISPEQAKANGFNLPEPVPIKNLILPEIKSAGFFKNKKNYINGKKLPKRKKK